MKKNKHEMINELIASFDFERVLCVMKALNWTWSDNNRTPKIKEMIYEAVKRINDAILDAENGDRGLPYISSCGGFKATAIADKDGDIGYIGLDFIVEEWEINIGID